MMVMMVREEAVVVLVLGVLVGVTREVLLLVRTDQVLGLVKQRLVGGTGGSGTGGGVAGVGVLLARELVGGGLGGGLVRVGDRVTVRRRISLVLMNGEMMRMAYRWTLSAPPVTVSLTFSVVDLELSGVTWSATSARSVSMRMQALRMSVERTVVEILAGSVRHVDGVVGGFVWLVGWLVGKLFERVSAVVGLLRNGSDGGVMWKRRRGREQERRKGFMQVLACRQAVTQSTCEAGTRSASSSFSW